MARGFYAIRNRSHSTFRKTWILAFTVLIIFLLVQMLILITPYFMNGSQDDTPAFNALKKQSGVTTQLINTTDIEIFSSDVVTKTTTASFERNRLHANQATSQHIITTDIPVTRSTDVGENVASEDSTVEYTVVQNDTTTIIFDTRTTETSNETDFFETGIHDNYSGVEATSPSTENMTEMQLSTEGASKVTENSTETLLLGKLNASTDEENSTEINVSTTITIDTESSSELMVSEKWNTSIDAENSTVSEKFSASINFESTTEVPSSKKLNAYTVESSSEIWESSSSSAFVEYENATEIFESAGVNATSDAENSSTEILESATTDSFEVTSEINFSLGSSFSTAFTERSHSNHDDRGTSFDEAIHGDESDMTEFTATESCPESNPTGMKKCTSKYCKKEASRMLYKMNFVTDKCQNFYDYACGNMRTMHQEDELAAVWDAIKREVNKIDESRPSLELDLKRFFQSCVEQTNTNYKLRKDAGRKLMTSIGWINNDYYTVENFTDVIIFLIQMNSFPLFDVSLEIDKSNTSRLSLTLSPPLQDGISLFDVYNEREKRCIEESTPDRENSHSINLNDAYHNYRECKQNHTAYINAIQEALIEFELIDVSSDVKEITDDIEKKITEIFEIGPDSITLDKMKSSFNNEVLTVGALNNLFNSLVNWEVLFNAIVNSTVFDFDTEIHVYGLNYFMKIRETLMKEEELWKVQNFLLANFAHNIFEYFFKVKNECNREAYCLEVTSRLMPDVVSNLYMRSFSKVELIHARKAAMNEFNLIKESMVRELNNESNTILDEDESRQNLLGKVESFSVSLPAELDFATENVLHSSYSSFIVTDLSGYSYLEKAVRLITRSQLLRFSTYRMQPDSPQVIWLLFAKSFSPKSVYLYPLNKLAIPQVLIAENYQTRKLPAAIHIARLGHVISRGLVASFDPIGCHFDFKNKYTAQYQCNGMLTGKARDIFSLNLLTAESMGFLQTYVEDGITYIFTPRGDLSIEERISDVSATFLALETLKRLNNTERTTLPWGDLTYQQVFLIAVAQTFCSKMSFYDSFPTLFEKKSLSPSYNGVLPPSLRVMQMMSHMEEFVSLFRCKAGSTMDATIKLDPFPFRTYEIDY